MSSRDNRRSLDELVQRYKRNPGMGRDIYVEGVNDKSLVEYYLRLKSLPKNAAYSIDTVDVPAHLLVAAGLRPGSNRSRLIVMRDYLDTRGVDMDRISFVVDRDQEDLHRTSPLVDRMEISDWGALDLSLVHDTSLEKLAGVFCSGRVSGDALRVAVFSIAREIYLLRSAAKRLKLDVKILGPSDFIAVNGEDILFDRTTYVDRCLNASALWGRHADVIAEIEKCRIEALALGLREQVTANDHDVMAILFKIIRSHGGLVNRSDQDIRNLLLMGLDTDLLDGMEVFKRIRAP